MPSIIDGLFAGRAGIQTHGTGISVLADNIANANTTGFKQSRADFSDLLAGNLTGAGSNVTGSGSTVVAVTPILTQGTFEFTGRGLDVGIDGNGYFVVEDSSGSGQRFYSRAGNFKLDTEGNLLNQNGFQVLGFPSSGTGSLQPLNVNDRGQNSIATSEVNIGGNLDANADIQAVPPGTPSFAQLSDASAFQNSFEVFDSLGASHDVTVFYFKTADNAWTANAYVDGADVTGGTAGTPFLLGSKAMTFSANGTRTPDVPDFNSTAPWANGSSAADIDFTFDPFTQFAASSNIQNLSQNGTGSGNVIGFQVESDGTLFAQLDNGQTATVGTIALATFANAEGLRRVGGSLFAQTTSSGEPVVGNPDSGQFGALESGALELSNGDIASDFIKLISLQRGFQGSARVITNINDLLNEIINLA